ncbi:MAG: four helix bundle protein [Caldilineaceae bacterium]
MTFNEWSASVPPEIRQDALWTVEVYRLALFLSDLCWHDVTKLMSDERMRRLIGQLYDAVGSVSANVAEGYSRGTGKDRARFYEYALGSARESRDWYFKARHILGQTVFLHRTQLLTQIIKLLLRMVPDQRKAVLKELEVSYEVNSTVSENILSTSTPD